eukprot:CAMPEP_0171112744 /NCGR_PEP_ID=MMETSP0766_2-20121228/80185_1 /TAXON_ID=439317 /ORGANISM="Gambierdiscus australes, Strain CAWD 149" /LENGTH=48 /DNA_ID= /DNA_START= /DNA_END= /DNA_ORIENTATION=
MSLNRSRGISSMATTSGLAGSSDCATSGSSVAQSGSKNCNPRRDSSRS